ncbi:DUF6869 domain-containing protein [Ideonella paludis]|uniref:DUF6869 domain-containing protein n=1 Tax=Ideonella paludis TaxID=1233411 RepID=A0ABS5DZ51_9BURK|nr:hypothetical protein [Ideonella paludis]
MTDRNALVTAWLTYQRNWWAFEALDDLIRESPVDAWETLLALIDSAEPEMLEQIGAGPLEDFVGAHADTYIERLEQEASTNLAFQKAMKSVWLKPGENGVVERLVILGCEVVPVNSRPEG